MVEVVKLGLQADGSYGLISITAAAAAAGKTVATANILERSFSPEFKPPTIIASGQITVAAQANNGKFGATSTVNYGTTLSQYPTVIAMAFATSWLTCLPCQTSQLTAWNSKWVTPFEERPSSVGTTTSGDSYPSCGFANISTTPGFASARFAVTPGLSSVTFVVNNAVSVNIRYLILSS